MTRLAIRLALMAAAAAPVLTTQAARAEGAGCAGVVGGSYYDSGRSSQAADDVEARRLAASRTVFFDSRRGSCLAYGVGESACLQVSGRWHRDAGHGAVVCEFRPSTASAPGSPRESPGTPDRATCDAVEVRLQQFIREEGVHTDGYFKLSGAAQCAAADQWRGVARRKWQFMLTVVQGGCPGFGSRDISLSRDGYAIADKAYSDCVRFLGPSQPSRAAPPSTGNCGVVPGERRPLTCTNGQPGCHCLSLHNNCPWPMRATVQVSGRSFAENVVIPANTTVCSIRTGQGSHQTSSFQGATRTR